MPRAAPRPARRAVAILNQKGGVGKTTVTLGLASAAAAAGRPAARGRPRPAGVVDVGARPRPGHGWWRHGRRRPRRERPARPRSCPHAGTMRSSCCPAAPATSAAADREGTARLRAALAALPEDRYDAILLDCPPTLGGSTLAALTVARHALIVVDPSALGLRGIGSVADAVDGVWDGDNPDLDLCGVVVNRVPAISDGGRSAPRRARPDRRAQHDLEATDPPACHRQPGPRRAPPDPRLRQPRRRRQRRLRPAVETPAQGRADVAGRSRTRSGARCRVSPLARRRGRPYGRRHHPQHRESTSNVLLHRLRRRPRGLSRGVPRDPHRERRPRGRSPQRGRTGQLRHPGDQQRSARRPRSAAHGHSRSATRRSPRTGRPRRSSPPSRHRSGSSRPSPPTTAPASCRTARRSSSRCRTGSRPSATCSP